jgi:hypothetical protein
MINRNAYGNSPAPSRRDDEHRDRGEQSIRDLLDHQRRKDAADAEGGMGRTNTPGSRSQQGAWYKPEEEELDEYGVPYWQPRD